MRVCIDSNVAEILRDAGPEVRHNSYNAQLPNSLKGLHVSEITARSGSRIDSTKLGK